MSYKISATDLTNIRFKEMGTVNEVLRNIAVILATPKGSVPQYREFGLDNSFLDKPLPIARTMAVMPVREAIEQWEPRATYKNITVYGDPSNPGKLTFTVEVEINVSES